jgi:hypothetical protein
LPSAAGTTDEVWNDIFLAQDGSINAISNRTPTEKKAAGRLFILIDFILSILIL